jgi:NitT/TauT family transport system ATP-binding protein
VGSTGGAELARFEGISLAFPAARRHGAVAVISDFTLAIGAGEFVSIIGPSGCGKSTVLALLAGYLAPTAGRVLFAGEPILGPGRERMMVFQQPALFPWLTAAGNVAYGLKLRANRTNAGQIEDRVARALGLVQLQGFAAYYPNELSGGMRQRLEIARALAVDPQMLLMDEPLGALDALTRRAMQREVLRIWAETRKTIVFVTHDVEEAVIMADRIVVMTPRPSVVREVVPVTLPRPRDPHAPDVAGLARHLATLLD